MEISSCGSIPTLLPDKGSPLPAHHPAEAAAMVPGQKSLPWGGSRREGRWEHCCTHPKPRALLAQAEDLMCRAGTCSIPGEETPSSGKEMKKLTTANVQEVATATPPSKGCEPRTPPGSDSDAPAWAQICMNAQSPDGNRGCLITRADDISQKCLLLAGVSEEIRLRGCSGCRDYANGIIC